MMGNLSTFCTKLGVQALWEVINELLMSKEKRYTIDNYSTYVCHATEQHRIEEVSTFKFCQFLLQIRGLGNPIHCIDIVENLFQRYFQH